MRVKVVKLDDNHEHSKEELKLVGKVFEAVKYRDKYRDEEVFALGLEDCVWHIKAECCEIIDKPQMVSDDTDKWDKLKELLKEYAQQLHFMQEQKMLSDIGISKMDFADYILFKMNELGKGE